MRHLYIETAPRLRRTCLDQITYRDKSFKRQKEWLQRLRTKTATKVIKWSTDVSLYRHKYHYDNGLVPNSHFPKQCSLIVSCILGINFSKIEIEIQKFSYKKLNFINFVCKMSIIHPIPQCVKCFRNLDIVINVFVLNIHLSSTPLKRKWHFAEIVMTGCTGTCQNGTFQRSQWWQFRQNDISVSLSCNLVNAIKFVDSLICLLT